MNIQKHNFEVVRTARYFTCGMYSDKVKNVWVVCHGYGQLAEYFILKFESVADEENYIIAPEGLHRYYLDKDRVRTGATWMTRDDREKDIQDYVGLLTTIFNREIKDFKGQLILLGFSQGVSTICRWLVYGNIKPHHLILWAGGFPPDVPAEKMMDTLKETKTFLVIGDEDEFIHEERKSMILQEAARIKKDVEFISFHGKHTIDIQVLKEIKNKI
jgi:predicted esterase